MEGNELRRLIDRLSGAFLTRKEGATACRTYNSTTITIANATATYLTYDTEATGHDLTGMHSTATNTGRITVSVPGSYLFGCSHEWAGGAGGICLTNIFINRTTLIAAVNQSAVGPAIQHVSGIYRCSANDYAEVQVYQNSGGNLNVGGTTFAGLGMNFWACRIA